jgi:tetratricopeptide (TPR) repeat protein
VQILFFAGTCFAQQVQSINKTNSSTYALVVGISKYKEKAIPSLKFADKDARLFAEFLQSEAGGKVPPNQIKLLLNEKATTAAIYAALYEIMEITPKNSQVFFYFSGHGDVEQKTIANLGFLLAHNSPPNNYINYAVRIEDINNFANTLSVQKDIKVVLITDACRSGKLAGDAINGRRFIGRELSKVKNNEVRIASCGPDELSAEGPMWGNGRGVFSYYLLQGLYGQAAGYKSTIINVANLSTYLNQKFATDKILKAENHKQNPILKGNTQLSLAAKSPGTHTAVAEQPTSNNLVPTLPIDIFSEALASGDLEAMVNFKTMIGLNDAQIRARIFDAITPMLDDEKYKSVMQLSRLTLNNVTAAKRVNERIATVISDRGQEVVTAYLKGDVAELENRNYYNVNSGVQENYVCMYEVALKLLPPGHLLQRPISISKNYFEGLLWRLKIPTVKNGTDFLVKAFMAQQSALKLEPFAAYIHNELGILYVFKQNKDSALWHYKQALRLAPTWALPHANLIAYYNGLGDFEKASEAAVKAKALQPDLQSVYVNEAITEISGKHWLKAEGLLKQSLLLNNKHYLPFEKLGMVYAATTRYQMADSLFNLAAKRKLGFYFPAQPDVTGILQFGPWNGIAMSTGPCFTDPTMDTMANPYIQLLIAIEKSFNYPFDEAEPYFLSALFLEPDNFLVNHYYAAALLKQNRLSEAVYFYEKAKQFFTDLWPDTLLSEREKQILPESFDFDCFKRMISKLNYNRVDDALYLAKIYARLGYLNKAEAQYQQLSSTPDFALFVALHYLLADLYMTMGDYEAVENTWIKYRENIDQLHIEGDAPNHPYNIIKLHAAEGFEMEVFYDSITKKYPASAYWHKKQATYWHQKIKRNPGWYYPVSLKPYGEGRPDWQMESMRTLQENIFKIRVDFDNSFRVSDFAGPLPFPYQKAIDAHEQLMKLAETDMEIATSFEMLAELYLVTGQFKLASDFYTKALAITPSNPQLRSQLAASFGDASLLYEEFSQLDTLKQSGLLLLNDYILYARMAMLGKHYKKAAETLIHSQKLLKGEIDKVRELNGLLYFLQNDLRAVNYYKDSITAALSYPERLYAIATLYAANNKKEEAFKYVTEALENGFSYGYVLRFDPVWFAWENTESWKNLISNYKFITYDDEGKPVPISD